MRVEVHVYPKETVLDPQGKAIASALQRLGYAVTDVRAGKIFFLDVSEADREKARIEAGKMAEELLANTVIESYDVVIRE